MCTNDLHKQNFTAILLNSRLLGNQTCWDSNVFPYIKNASFSACSLAANTDLTRLDGFKEEDAIPVYSCPVL